MKYTAIIEASDPQDIADCPIPSVKITIVRNEVYLSGDYYELFQVLTQFVGLSKLEADLFIYENEIVI